MFLYFSIISYLFFNWILLQVYLTSVIYNDLNVFKNIALWSVFIDTITFKVSTSLMGGHFAITNIYIAGDEHTASLAWGR